TLEAFLAHYRFNVASVVSLGTDFTRIGHVTAADVYRAAKQATHEAGHLDGLYLPCPQFPALEIVGQIEKDLGIPVVPHLGSEVWAAFKVLGIKTSIHGFGRLLSSL
ncbi:MAG TPA: hypothetical protein VE131_04660, partial [Terriglobales bacterium]|nr:hypothetical protein [Terriglobales bacterium]